METVQTKEPKMQETQKGLDHEDGDLEKKQVQSPPLIVDDGGDHKGGNEGSTLKDGGGEAEDHDTHVCIIDVRNIEEENDERESSVSNSMREKVCRICQVGSDDHDQVHPDAGNNNNKVNLVNLGCACKGELGVSHYKCAHAWFLHKGNRTCEICGKPAKNIKGIRDTGFRSMANSSSLHEMHGREDRENRCTMSLCNFLLAIVILAFFLPWFFRPGKLL